MKYIVSCLFLIAADNQIFQSGYQELHRSWLKTSSYIPILDQFMPTSGQQYDDALRFQRHQEHC